MAAHRSSYPRPVPVLVYRHAPVDTTGTHLLGSRSGSFIRNSENLPEMQIAMARESLIQRARASAGGGHIHQVEQLIGAYRMYGAVLQRRPADCDSRQKFQAVESLLERQAA
jgi:hypothetical protein